MSLNLSALDSRAARRAIIALTLIPVLIFAVVRGACREVRLLMSTAIFQWRRKA